MDKRKSDHINLAEESRTLVSKTSSLLAYEPVLSGNLHLHPKTSHFGPWTFELPLWISSMTGGAQEAHQINGRLARATKYFGLGMGLGSCRPLWSEWQKANFSSASLHRLAVAKDFLWRDVIGDRPLFANFGIAQLETILRQNQTAKFEELLSFLSVDGVCLHINPLQELLQPEGDRWTSSPLEILAQWMEQLKSDYKIIVKEVGHGMGPKSLAALSRLPIFAVEFAGLGGTNFSWIEWKRSQRGDSPLQEVTTWGHTAAQMCEIVYALKKAGQWTHPVIISGGVREWSPSFDWLKTFEKQEIQSIVGAGWPFMAKAMEGEDELFKWLEELKSLYQIHQLMMD
jgi:isopentenyl-diphosphate delta-isomerase